jgi:diaminopimelate decarboxylase
MIVRSLWPSTMNEGSIGGVALAEIAARFGTPAYVVDEDQIRRRCRAYAATGFEVAYAAKAFLCRAMARWVDEEGLSLDVCSEGELIVASAVGFPADRILLHGNGKTPHELTAALDYGVGRIVVDSLGEVSRLAALGRHQRILLRVTPGVDAHVHKAVTTGTEDQKFGLSLSSGAAAEAVRRILGQPSLELVGLHCHIGSQIADVASYELAARRLIAFMASIAAEHGAVLPELNLGGGHAVSYRDGEPALDIEDFAVRVAGTVRDECAAWRIPAPRLTIEPGRAIVGQAGLTLYRVITMKRGARTFVVVDGGMSDNPRPALYGSRYSVERVAGGGSELAPMTVVGRHCEAGDVLVPDVPLPADLRPGDLLAVPCTGAYHHAMASNYNHLTRPPVVAVADGRARLIVRRETDEDLLRRDVG